MYIRRIIINIRSSLFIKYNNCSVGVLGSTKIPNSVNTVLILLVTQAIHSKPNERVSALLLLLDLNGLTEL